MSTLRPGLNRPRVQPARLSDLVQEIPQDEAAAFVSGSQFLATAHGYFPQGWKFYPYSLAPQLALDKMQHLLGIRRAGRLAALLCAGRPSRGAGEFGIDFLDGDEEACEVLLRHALGLARERRVVQAPVPKFADLVAPALALFRRLGFEAWNGFDEDIFVYERSL